MPVHFKYRNLIPSYLPIMRTIFLCLFSCMLLLGPMGFAQNSKHRFRTQDDKYPLIIIDGAAVKDTFEFGLVEPNDVGSMTVIKGDSALKYGELASDGVILVTTKSGDFPEKLREFHYKTLLDKLACVYENPKKRLKKTRFVLNEALLDDPKPLLKLDKDRLLDLRILTPKEGRREFDSSAAGLWYVITTKGD